MELFLLNKQVDETRELLVLPPYLLAHKLFHFCFAASEREQYETYG